jgi:sugar phosphate isomerase/epimerase
MAISRASLDSIPTSFASVSVGTANDPLPDKLRAIAAAGFQAIELGFPDLVSFASTRHKREIKDDDYESLCSGVEVRKLCAENKLEIMMLQPFSNFEGWPGGSKERTEALERASGWIKIMQAVGTDMLQVGSSDYPNISSDFEDLAADLRTLCDMLAHHSFRLSYENWCWATHACVSPCSS